MTRALLVVLVACSPTTHPAAPALLEQRPYAIHVPHGHDAARATPVVIELHGYGDDAKSQQAYFRFDEVADSEGFLVVRPEGTRDSAGNRFWNATDACCDFGGTGVDDVAYISAVLDDVERRYRVDPARVYVVGHSNGAFMAHRLACDLAPRIAAIAGQAGATWSDPARCKPRAKVSVMVIAGDADPLVKIGGGSLDEATLAPAFKQAGLSLPSPFAPGPRAYPGAEATAAMWAALDGCSEGAHKTLDVDLDTSLPGDESELRQYGCRGTGAGVFLFTIHGGGHMPAFPRPPAQPVLAEAIWTFFQGHPKR